MWNAITLAVNPVCKEKKDDMNPIGLEMLKTFLEHLKEETDSESLRLKYV